MPLPSGSKLGPYEILALIGAGGMGEVYRAKDTRLERSVAVKILPAHFSSKADLRERFEREARAVSSLNHPNICTLHDVGHQEGVDYLVMELIDGESLTSRIAKGPLPTDQALRIASEIASALDRAHRSGIVHRDLKPGNIMLVGDFVKLLDFGVAKSETYDDVITHVGMMIGTPTYMAPEAISGDTSDPRTDLYALGCIIYELLTGTSPFAAPTVAATFARQLEGDPPELPEHIPIPLRDLVSALLAKSPADRPPSAISVRDLLLAVLEPDDDQPTLIQRPVTQIIELDTRLQPLRILAVLIAIAIVAFLVLAFLVP
jgi:serine/threonine protein kinase